MCNLCAFRFRTCWKRVILVILTCLVKFAALLKHPECRSPPPICSRHKTSISDTKFMYNVIGTGEKQVKQLVVEYDSKEQFFRMCCNFGLAADDPALPAMKTPTIVKRIEFQGCKVPKVAYASVIADLNLSFSPGLKDGVLQLTELPAMPQLEGYHLEGLLIKKLSITSAEDDPPTRPKSNFLEHLQKLKYLELQKFVQPENEAVMHLPESLVELSLWTTQLTLDRESRNGSFWLKRLRSLNKLIIGEAEAPTGSVVTLPPLALLPNLTKLELHEVPLAPLSDSTTWLKGSKLQNLKIHNCDLNELPNGMFEGTDIVEITLTKNKMKILNDAFTPLQSSLRYVDLSDNMLNIDAVANAVAPLKKLETLIVNNNHLNLNCKSNGINMPSHMPTSLRHLELKNTGATSICYDWVEHDSLTYLNLDNNKIQNLWYSELQMRRYKNETVTLSLRNNTLRIKNITQDHYNVCIKESSGKHGEGYKRVPVILNMDLSVCDCNAYWLREMMSHCPLLKADHVTCSALRRTSLFDFDTASLTCPYPGPCPDGCSCNKRPKDNATVVRCSDALPRGPRWPPATPGYPLALHVAPGTLDRVPNLKLVELWAPYNNITQIDETDLPDTLRVLDVRNNSIRHITFDAAQQLLRLSTIEGYKVSLAGNPLACGCEDESAIATLQQAKISDWNTTQCADHQLIIGKTKLCRDNRDIMLPTLLSVTGTLFILTLITLILLYFRPRIRQFFFDHNCCLRCWFSFKDDVNDPLKTHDVFISYSFHDSEYVKTLIKKLEEHGHSTIEHCRDWLPGRAISQQITDSVLSARRTLLLVSDNFANSQWGLEEFHAAHAHAIERGSACVIVIRCNLLAPEKLPDELRLYLNNNTYLDWSDRFFWKKLLQVMPTPRATQQVPAVSLIQDKMVQPLAGIQLAPPANPAPALGISRVSLDKELPLSELVLVASTQQLKHGTQQSSGQASPVTPVVREPPQSDDNKSLLPLDNREQVTAPRVPAVA